MHDTGRRGLTGRPRADGWEQRRSLGSGPPFADLSDRCLRIVDSLTYETVVSPGYRMALEGRYSRQVCFIVDGRATVRVRGTELATLRPGDAVGVGSVMRGCQSLTTVEARSPLRVRVAFARDFRSLAARVPSVLTAGRWEDRVERTLAAQDGPTTTPLDEALRHGSLR